MKKIKDTKDVTIFPISIGWYLREYCETHHCTGISHGMGIPHIGPWTICRPTTR